MVKDDFTGWVAEEYDALSGEMFAPDVIERTVSFLADASGDGAALELGIGTGRIALPLSQRGVRVDGIELSADMVAQLRAKPGGDAIDVTIGDFATTTAPGGFSLVYLVYNTISNLTTQDQQVECFCNAARHLEPGGLFVIELWIPDLQRLPPGETTLVFEVSESHVGVGVLDVATQRGVSHHYFVDGERVRRFDTRFRYAWPAELDLMARIAGLRLRERWADWDRSPFTSESRKHVSVWEKVDPA